MKLNSVLIIGVVFLGTSCNVGNYVTRTEFSERMMHTEQAIEDLRLCEQRRWSYVRRGQTCLHGMFMDDYDTVAEGLQADGIERDSENYEEEFDRRASELVDYYCHFACLYESVCYEPITPVCEHIDQDPADWRQERHNAAHERGEEVR